MQCAREALALISLHCPVSFLPDILCFQGERGHIAEQSLRLYTIYIKRQQNSGFLLKTVTVAELSPQKENLYKDFKPVPYVE